MSVSGPWRMGEHAGVSVNGLPYTVRDLLVLLEDARSYIAPTLVTHEEISDILGWCSCGYCTHVPRERPQ